MYSQLGESDLDSELLEYFEARDKKSTGLEEKYKIKKIRRLVIIIEDEFLSSLEKNQDELDQDSTLRNYLSKIKSLLEKSYIGLDKIYVLKNCYQIFL